MTTVATATAVTTATTSTGAAGLPWLVRRGLLALWRELPRSLGAGALAAATTVPLAVAGVAGAPGWLRALTLLPPALAATGLAGFATGVLDADVARMRMRTPRLDPVLAVVLAVGAGLAAAGLLHGGVAALAGAVGAAVGLLIAPLALAYGAIRGRTGLAALRGGAILAGYRPSWALTLLALGCLGGFAAAASLGVLAIVIAPLLATIAASVTSGLLSEIDALGGRRPPLPHPSTEFAQPAKDARA